MKHILLMIVFWFAGGAAAQSIGDVGEAEWQAYVVKCEKNHTNCNVVADHRETIRFPITQSETGFKYKFSVDGMNITYLASVQKDDFEGAHPNFTVLAQMEYQGPDQNDKYLSWNDVALEGPLPDMINIHVQEHSFKIKSFEYFGSGSLVYRIRKF